jgi:hypothetical protein
VLIEEATGGHHPESRSHLVVVIVDGHRHEVKAGRYVVAEFKRLTSVPAAKELDEVVDGKLTPLADDATIKIEGHEVFISHERTGGAS